jgi:serine/threonine-protein kinase
MGTMVNSQGNTTSSIVIGTPGFMPSEQAAGRPVYSSDLYSLGLTAIYLLTGKIPQELETDSRSGEIIWRQHAPRISPSFATLLDKAIMSHPRERYATAREMLDALQSTTAPQLTQLPSTQGTGKNILLGSLILGSLVSASMVVGLILTELLNPLQNNQ